jgi:hypothetical protein
MMVGMAIKETAEEITAAMNPIITNFFACIYSRWQLNYVGKSSTVREVNHRSLQYLPYVRLVLMLS